MAKVEVMYCEICNRPHNDRKLQEGWYAENYRKNKRIDSAKALLCPECVKKVFGQGG